MAGTLRTVRFKLAWQNYRVGDEITPNGTTRDWLVANGYVDIIEPRAKPPKGAAANLARAQTRQLV